MRVTWLLAVGILCAASSGAQAQAGGDPARGRLLYEMHCVACHSTQIHWRDQKLVTDWVTLGAQVRRWQENAGLRWSASDVDDVVRYLNSTIYRFPSQAPRLTG